jgi:uncharacterized metal-binding protein YceD (DUF177 family)
MQPLSGMFNLPIESRLQYVVQMLDPVPETTTMMMILNNPQGSAELDISQRVRESIILAIPINRFAVTIARDFVRCAGRI